MKKTDARTTQVGGFTTPKLADKLRTEAKKLGRSVSSHLHKIIEERYAPSPKED